MLERLISDRKEVHARHSGVEAVLLSGAVIGATVALASPASAEPLAGTYTALFSGPKRIVDDPDLDIDAMRPGLLTTRQWDIRQ